MSQLPKLTITEKKVLLCLLDGWRSDSNVHTFGSLAATLNIGLTAAKRACRSLAKKGLTEHSPYWTDDGLIGGSGYTLTCQGMGDVRYHEEALHLAIAEYEDACKPMQKLRLQGASIPQPVLPKAESSPPQANDVFDDWRGRLADNGNIVVERIDPPATPTHGLSVDHWRVWHERLDRPARQSRLNAWWRRILARFTRSDERGPYDNY